MDGLPASALGLAAQSAVAKGDTDATAEAVHTTPSVRNTVELIPTLGALFPRGRPVYDPVLTPSALNPHSLGARGAWMPAHRKNFERRLVDLGTLEAKNQPPKLGKQKP